MKYSHSLRVAANKIGVLYTTLERKELSRIARKVLYPEKIVML